MWYHVGDQALLRVAARVGLKPCPAATRLVGQEVAHRGASAHAPENTLAAIRHAHALGCEAVELDVSITRDGALILMHDRTVDRTTNGRGPVASHTLARACALDASMRLPGFAGERVPSLERALALAIKLGLYVVLDLKPGLTSARAMARALVEVVRARDAYDSVCATSLDPRLIWHVRRRDPQLRCGLTLMPPPRSPRVAALCRPLLRSVWLPRLLGVSVLEPHISLCDDAQLDRWQRAGYALNVWVVEDHATRRALRARGVAITTDAPGAPGQTRAAALTPRDD